MPDWSCECWRPCFNRRECKLEGSSEGGTPFAAGPWERARRRSNLRTSKNDEGEKMTRSGFLWTLLQLEFMSMLEVGIDDPRLRWKGFDRKSVGADPTAVCQHQMVGQKSVSNVALLPTREAPTIDSQRIASSHAGTVDSPGFNETWGDGRLLEMVFFPGDFKGLKMKKHLFAGVVSPNLHRKRKRSCSNQPFSGAMFVSFRKDNFRRKW